MNDPEFARARMQLAALVTLFIATGVYFRLVEPALAIAKNNDTLALQESELQELRRQTQTRAQLIGEVDRLERAVQSVLEGQPTRCFPENPLRDISYEAQQSGLLLDSFNPQEASQQGDYWVKSVGVGARGSWHQIAVFFDRLSKSPRTINVTNIQMVMPTMEEKLIAATFTVSLYRFRDVPPPTNDGS